MASGYCVPALVLFDGNLFSREKEGGGLIVRFEEEIKRSRFITTLAHADSRERALALVECVRREFPDARHHNVNKNTVFCRYSESSARQYFPSAFLR